MTAVTSGFLAAIQFPFLEWRLHPGIPCAATTACLSPGIYQWDEDHIEGKTEKRHVIEVRNRVAGSLGTAISTGPPLFSVQCFFFFLSREIAEAQRYGHFVSFFVFHLEQPFSGMETLASILRSSTRQTDYMGRIDSQTLGMILLNTTVSDAEAAATRLRREMRLHLELGSYMPVKVTFCVFPSEANSFETLRSLAFSRLENGNTKPQ